MVPGHGRQQKIIRLLAAVGLVALASRAARVEAQPASCVPCPVIGVEATSLKGTGELLPGSLEGLRVLVTAPPDSDAMRQAVRTLQAAGAIPGAVIFSGSPFPDRGRPRAVLGKSPAAAGEAFDRGAATSHAAPPPHVRLRAQRQDACQDRRDRQSVSLASDRR